MKKTIAALITGFMLFTSFTGCSSVTPMPDAVHALQKNPNWKDAPYRPYFDPGHFKIGCESKKQPLSMSSYLAFAREKSHSMKV